MLISIKVFAGAGKEAIVEDKGRLRVFVREPAQDNRANRAVERALAGWYGVRTEQVRIVRGHTSPNKTVQIPDCQQNNVEK